VSKYPKKTSYIKCLSLPYLPPETFSPFSASKLSIIFISNLNADASPLSNVTDVDNRSS